MKNFDEARMARNSRDRSFMLGGEEFVMKVGVRPEALAAYDDIVPSMPALDIIKIVDQIILEMVEPDNDAHGRYEQLRARDEDPVTLGDLQAVVEWLIEEQMGRPTQPSSPSTVGRGRTRTTSTESSSSKELAASTA